ncbi:MAG: autotransporter-associated beta strand repeat-containing protein [Pirellulales bacterium]|nr:autotransporter-associated beta strand repeat-containing protein [Pirellulales bacterium]
MDFLRFFRKCAVLGLSLFLVLSPYGPQGSFFSEDASAASLTWLGYDPSYNPDATWEANTSIVVWDSTGDSLPDTYYSNGDIVTFNDMTGYGYVNLVGELTPDSVTVDGYMTYDFSGSGYIAGSTGISKSGDGTLTVSTANTFSGAVSVTGGTFTVGHATALGNATGATAVNGGALDLGGFDIGEEDVSIQGTGIYDTGAIVNSSGTKATLKHLTLTGDTTIGGFGDWRVYSPLASFNATFDAGGHTLTKVGANRIDVENAIISNIGDIDIREGTLDFGNVSFGDSGKTITVRAGAMLRTYMDSSGSDLTVSSNIVSEGGTLYQKGTHNHIFTGDIQLNGDTTINVDTSSPSGTNNCVLAGPVSGSYGIIKAATWRWLILTNNNNTYYGDNTIPKGSFQIGLGGAGSTGKPGTGNFNLTTADAVLRFNSDQVYTVTGDIAGTEGLVEYGSSTTGDLPNAEVTLNGDKSYTFNTTIYGGIVKLNSALGLGTTDGSTSIQGGSDYQGALKLSGNINVAENLTLTGRQDDAASAPHVINGSGGNTLSGSISLNMGGNQYNLQSDDGLLTVASALANSNSSDRYLNLQGAGNGAIDGNITRTAGTFHVVKKGAGVWTLNGSGNDYNGTTTVTGGTLKLGPSATIAASPTIDVHNGAFFDVASVSGGFALAGTQTLMGNGTIVGNVTTSGGSVVVPGESVGQLTFNGDLTLAGGETLQFELSNDPGGANDQILVTGTGNLYCNTGVTTIDVTMIDGSLSTGTYSLIDCAGTAYGSAGNFSLAGAVSGTTRQDFDIITTATPGKVELQVSGDPWHLTWKGNVSSDWDVVGDANWDSTGGTTEYYELDHVTFDNSGSNASPINIEADVTPSSITVTNSSGHDYTFEGAGILGFTGLTKNGDAALTIKNDGNAFTGNIALNGGTLAFQQSTDAQYDNAISGAGTLKQEGPNTLSLGGDHSGFTGPVSVTGGVLKLGSESTLGTADSGTSVNGGTLDLNGKNIGAEAVTIQGTGAGTGAMVNSSGTGSMKYLTLAGAATVGGSSSWNVAGADANDLGVFDMGGHTLTKVGTNQVGLGFVNLQNLGDIDITEGTVNFSTDMNYGDGVHTITVRSGATLRNYNSDVNSPVISEGGMFWLKAGNQKYTDTVDLYGAADTTIKVEGSSLTLSGPVSGTQGIVKTYSGTLYLTSNGNTYGGTTTISNGTLSFGKAGNLTGKPGTGGFALAGGAYLVFRTNESFEISSTITGGDSTTNVEYGHEYEPLPDSVITLSGNNTYLGATHIYNGTVVVKSDGALGDSSDPATGWTWIRGYDNGQYGGALQLDGSGGNLNIAQSLSRVCGSGRPGAARYDDSGAIRNVAGNNTISGNVNVTGGGGSPVIKVAAGSLTLAGYNNTIRTDAPAGVRGFVLGGEAGTGGGFITGVLADADSNHVMSLTKIDSGSWTIANAQTYTGPTNIYAGSLALNEYGSIYSSRAIVLQTSSATLDLSPRIDQTFYVGGSQGVFGVGMINGNVNTSAGTVMISPSGPAVLDYAAAGKETVNLTGGTMHIGGNLDFSYVGDTLQFKLADDAASLHNDKIAVNGNLAGNAGVVKIVPNTTLDTTGTYTLLTYNGTGTGYFPGTATHDTRYSMTLANTAGLLTLSVSGSNADLTWAGDDGVNPNLWDVITTDNWSGDPDGRFYQADAVTFGSGPTVREVTLVGDINGDLYPASITVQDTDYTFTGDGRISSGAGIEVKNSGTLTIANTGVNDFNGEVNVNSGGTLIADTEYALGSNAGGTVVDGGTLDVNGQKGQIRTEPISLTGNGAVVNGGGSGTFLTYLTLTGDGTIGGSSDLNVHGPRGGPWEAGYLHGDGNTLTKTGANTVELIDVGDTALGGLNVTDGSMIVSGNTTLGGASATISLSNNASLVFGRLRADSSDWLDLASTGTHVNPLAVAASGGTLKTRFGNATLTGNGVLDGTLNVETDAETTMTLGGALADGTATGSLTKTGDGRLVLGGANTYEGDTTISAGVLELVSGGQIDEDSLITNDGGLEVTGGAHAASVIEGSGVTSVSGSASLTAVSITQGTLSIGGAGGGAAASAAPVPEPSVWILFAAAGALCGLYRWMKKR